MTALTLTTRCSRTQILRQQPLHVTTVSRHDRYMVCRVLLRKWRRQNLIVQSADQAVNASEQPRTLPAPALNGHGSTGHPETGGLVATISRANPGAMNAISPLQSYHRYKRGYLVDHFDPNVSVLNRTGIVLIVRPSSACRRCRALDRQPD
jgi:hypothetical protein